MVNDWHQHFILSSAATNPGERSVLYRAAARGAFVKVVPGVYLPSREWEPLDFEGRHIARMRAVELIRPGTVFSHLSAALVWGLPVIGGDLAVPHSVAAVASGGRSMNALRRHAVGVPIDLRTEGGLTVTSIQDTVLAIAAGYPPEVSVPVLDAALRLPGALAPIDELLELAARLPASSGSARCAWAIKFANAAAGSAGESLSRVAIHRLGFPAPLLQVRFEDALGLIGFVDFWWPDQDVIGEFDGLGKYLREEFAHGRSPAEVVLEEKRRENRLRALGPRVGRWGWPVARNRSALATVLTDAGLRRP
jgi:hypothetical protein